MPNATTKTVSATVYGIKNAVMLFERLDHDGWSVQLDTMGQGSVSYRIIVVGMPEVIFEFTCQQLGIEVEIDF